MRPPSANVDRHIDIHPSVEDQLFKVTLQYDSGQPLITRGELFKRRVASSAGHASPRGTISARLRSTKWFGTRHLPKVLNALRPTGLASLSTIGLKVNALSRPVLFVRLDFCFVTRQFVVTIFGLDDRSENFDTPATRSITRHLRPVANHRHRGRNRGDSLLDDNHADLAPITYLARLVTGQFRRRRGMGFPDLLLNGQDDATGVRDSMRKRCQR